MTWLLPRKSQDPSWPVITKRSLEPRCILQGFSLISRLASVCDRLIVRLMLGSMRNRRILLKAYNLEVLQFWHVNAT